MSLTGTPFLVLTAILTLLAFGAAVTLMPRLPGWRARPLAARSLLLVAVNVLILLTAGIAMNDQYGFYANWADLHGALFGGTVASTTAHAGAAASQAGDGPAGVHPGPTSSATNPAAARPASSEPTLPPNNGGRLVNFTVTGARSGLIGTVRVGLPLGYNDAANQTQTYPVLETYPGYPGTPSQWDSAMSLPSALDLGVTHHSIGPVITISPTTEFPAGVDTECVNGPPKDPQVETWLTEDVPQWVIAHLRVRTDRASWATIGLSAGAWCAAMTTMLHPAQYAAAIVMGGYFHPEFSANYQLFAPSSSADQRYDLISLARLRPPSVAMWVETSHADPISYPTTSQLLAVARSPLSVQALTLKDAGHRISLWASELPQALQWLGSNIAGFRPAPLPAI